MGYLVFPTASSSGFLPWESRPTGWFAFPMPWESRPTGSRNLRHSTFSCSPLAAERPPPCEGGRLVDVPRKPSSVSREGRPPRGSDHSSRATVTGRLEQPTRRLGRATLSDSGESDACLRGLAPDGVCRATLVTEGAVGSYPAVSPLPVAGAAKAAGAGGLFSVALSSAFPPPGVTRHRTLWSSDFPPAFGLSRLRPAIACEASTAKD
jgi:hypothetical protein